MKKQPEDRRRVREEGGRRGRTWSLLEEEGKVLGAHGHDREAGARGAHDLRSGGLYNSDALGEGIHHRRVAVWRERE
jgi:hypothetical protein